MSNLNEQIEGQLENIVKGISNVQEICDRNSKRISTIDEEQIVKLNETVTKSMEKISEFESRNKKIDEAILNLEKIAARPANAKEEKTSAAKLEIVKYLRRGTIPTMEMQNELAGKIASKRLVYGQKTELELMTKTLVEGNNPDGGYWLIPELADFMINRVFETSPLRNVSRVITISGESIDIIVDDNEAEGDWVGEVDVRPETDTPKIGQKSIFAHELAANPKASQRMIDDAGFDLPDWLMTKVRDIFERKENTAFVVGDGSKRPRGLLTYPAAADPDVYERETVGQLDSGSAGAFVADNLISLQNLVKEPYQPNAVWLMHRSTFGDVMKLKNVDGTYLINPAIIAQGASKVILGNPVIFASDMPKVATNSLSIVYGDFGVGYTVVDRMGIRLLRDPFTSKPFILFYTTKRVGGDVTNYDSFKILKLAA